MGQNCGATLNPWVGSKAKMTSLAIQLWVAMRNKTVEARVATLDSEFRTTVLM